MKVFSLFSEVVEELLGLIRILVWVCYFDDSYYIFVSGIEEVEIIDFVTFGFKQN